MRRVVVEEEKKRLIDLMGELELKIQAFNQGIAPTQVEYQKARYDLEQLRLLPPSIKVIEYEEAK